jgi:SAM-dependent methyltransferase
VISSSDGAALARLYDLDLAIDPGDLDLYLALASRTGGPVLELAVGTGRLAVPLAAGGHAVVGVDRDAAMLARAGERWREAQAAGPVPAGGSLELVAGDLFAADRGPRFGLVVLALNSLLLLGSASRQADALVVMARHLRPDGVAVVDVVVPDAGALAAYDGRLSLEWVREDPGTGDHVAKFVSATYEPAARRVELTTIFESAPVPGGAVTRHVRQDVLHLLSVDELLRAAADAGLEVEALATDYGLSPLGPGADRAILVARPRPRTGTGPQEPGRLV